MDTFVVDQMGSLLIWKGEVEPKRVGKYLYEPEPDEYLQAQVDVDAVVEQMDAIDKRDLLNGWEVYASVEWGGW